MQSTTRIPSNIYSILLLTCFYHLSIASSFSSLSSIRSTNTILLPNGATTTRENVYRKNDIGHNRRLIGICNTKRESTLLFLSKDSINTDKKKNQSPTSIKESILSLAIPALAGLIIDPLMSLVDTIFIGKYSSPSITESSTALAGIGSSTSILTFSFCLFAFLSSTTTPLVAVRRSSNQGEEAVSIASQALTLSLLLGVVVCSILLLSSQSLLTLMGTGYTGAAANEYALTFLRIRAFSAPAVFFNSACIGILRGYLDTKTSIVILVGANLINVALDFVLIVGFNFGPTGAAIATTTAETIAAISFFGILSGYLPAANGLLGRNQQPQNISTNNSTNNSMIKITPSLKIPPLNELKPLLLASSSSFLRSVTLQLALVGAAAMVARNTISTSTTNVAAHQIAIQLWLLGSFTCDALAAASQALIANGIGRRDQIYILNVTKSILLYSLYLGVFLCILFSIGSQSFNADNANSIISNLFTNDSDVKEALNPILPLIVFSQPLNSIVFASDGILQGAAEFSYQSKGMVLSVAVAFLYYYIVSTGGSGDGSLLQVWQALIVLQAMRGITSFMKILDPNGPIQLTRF